MSKIILTGYCKTLEFKIGHFQPFWNSQSIVVNYLEIHVFQRKLDQKNFKKSENSPNTPKSQKTSQ
jgi:hypothetical protein